MTQYWTTNKPEKAGWWWGNNNGAVSVYHVTFDGEVFCAAPFEPDDIYPLSHYHFNKFLWGSSPISEPSTRKY